MTRLIETLISGLSLGSIYALMALGYTSLKRERTEISCSIVIDPLSYL